MRAIWITNAKTLLPALFSVQSFLEYFDSPVTIIHCGLQGWEKAQEEFAKIQGDVTLKRSDPSVGIPRPEFLESVIHRFARMEALIEVEEDYVMLFEPGVLFGEAAANLISDIKAVQVDEPTVWGVPDYAPAWRTQSYYHSLNKEGKENQLHPYEQQEILGEVFGTQWQFVLNSYAYNTGVLAFYKPREIAKKWKECYLTGLGSPKVNPDCDKIPLAAAIWNTNSKSLLLNEKYNSKGELTGNYSIFYPLEEGWQMPLYSMQIGHWASTDFGGILEKYWETLPIDTLRSHVKNLKSVEPFRYKNITGGFRSTQTYTDVVNKFDNAHFVEVGTEHGKGACFMAEAIFYADKSIRLDSIDPYSRPETSLAKASDNLRKAGVLSQVNLISETSAKASANYHPESLDFIFLNLSRSKGELLDDLNYWLLLLKPQGLLAGIDPSIQQGLNLDNESSVISFCEQGGHCCRVIGNEFFIEKKTSEYRNPNNLAADIFRHKVGF